MQDRIMLKNRRTKSIGIGDSLVSPKKKPPKVNNENVDTSKKSLILNKYYSKRKITPLTKANNKRSTSSNTETHVTSIIYHRPDLNQAILTRTSLRE